MTVTLAASREEGSAENGRNSVVLKLDILNT